MVPPFRRAYSQLKIKVRALPTWRNPVGDGANRTRDRDVAKLPFFNGLAEVDMQELMLRAEEKRRQAGAGGAGVIEQVFHGSFHNPCTEIVLSSRPGP